MGIRRRIHRQPNAVKVALDTLSRTEHWCVGEGLCSHCEAVETLETYIGSVSDKKKTLHEIRNQEETDTEDKRDR